jgi:hypothetical protein
MMKMNKRIASMGAKSWRLWLKQSVKLWVRETEILRAKAKEEVAKADVPDAIRVEQGI